MAKPPVSQIVLSVILFSFHTATYCQQLFHLQVTDKQTGKPISYAAVSIKNSTRGYIANEEGRVSGTSGVTDTLLISMLGYRPLKIAVAALTFQERVKLEPLLALIPEITIHGGTDHLYAVMDKCRTRLLRCPTLRSKAYFLLQSEVNKQPSELIECYYNSRHSCANVEELVFKNGRAMLATVDSVVFLCVDISQAFIFGDLAVPYERMPLSPLQLPERKTRRRFNLEMVGYSGAGGELIHIRFSPRNKQKMINYSGEVWINRTDSTLAKVVLEAALTDRHPFSSLHRNQADIGNVSIRLEKHFVREKENMYPRHATISYEFDFIPKDKRRPAASKSRVRSTAFLYFYDYGNLFIPPYFKYEGQPTDYRKIQAMSYNEEFWLYNNTMMYSESMKKNIRYFRERGMLFNYRTQLSDHNDPTREIPFFEHPYLKWSPRSRLLIKEGGLTPDTMRLMTKTVAGTGLYELDAQIYLDVNINNGRTTWYTTTVFDTYNSFFAPKATPESHCFINMYFDLYELQRRRLENELHARAWPLKQIDSLYTAHQRAAEKESAQFELDVFRGRDKEALQRWNKYIAAELGIDNIQIFGAGDRKKDP